MTILDLLNQFDLDTLRQKLGASLDNDQLSTNDLQELYQLVERLRVYKWIEED